MLRYFNVQIWPITDYPEEELCVASQHLVQQHITRTHSARILMQVRTGRDSIVGILRGTGICPSKFGYVKSMGALARGREDAAQFLRELGRPVAAISGKQRSTEFLPRDATQSAVIIADVAVMRLCRSKSSVRL